MAMRTISRRSTMRSVRRFIWPRTGRATPAATRAVRWVSILLGALLILVTYRCILTLVPEEPMLALGTAAFVGLLPSNVALSASVTNDSLTTLVIAVALWLLVRLVLVIKSGEDSPGSRGRPSGWVSRWVWVSGPRR